MVIFLSGTGRLDPFPGSASFLFATLEICHLHINTKLNFIFSCVTKGIKRNLSLSGSLDHGDRHVHTWSTHWCLKK